MDQRTHLLCVDWTDAKALFASHIEGLRRHPFLRHAWIISMIERNTGHESGHLSEVAAAYPRVYSVYQDAIPDAKRDMTPKANPGVFTGNNKVDYAKTLIAALNDGAVRFLDTCVCANPFKDEEVALEKTKRELYAQISRARWVASSRSVDIGAPRTGWSAKSGADGHIVKGAQDDLVVTLAMGIYWMNRILSGRQRSVDYELIGLGVAPSQY